jgi:hypothetical protein
MKNAEQGQMRKLSRGLQITLNRGNADNAERRTLDRGNADNAEQGPSDNAEQEESPLTRVGSRGVTPDGVLLELSTYLTFPSRPIT